MTISSLLHIFSTEQILSQLTFSFVKLPASVPDLQVVIKNKNFFLIEHHTHAQTKHDRSVKLQLHKSGGMNEQDRKQAARGQ